MNIDILRCIELEGDNVVKEIQLGETKVKFCNDFIAIEKDEREKRIQSFKQAYAYLLKGVDEK